MFCLSFYCGFFYLTRRGNEEKETQNDTICARARVCVCVTFWETDYVAENSNRGT